MDKVSIGTSIYCIHVFRLNIYQDILCGIVSGILNYLHVPSKLYFQRPKRSFKKKNHNLKGLGHDLRSIFNCFFYFNV